MSVIFITRGDSRTLDLTATRPDGFPFDLSSISLWFTVKRGVDDADEDALISKMTGDGIEITNGPAGRATISLTPAETSSLRGNASLVFDVQASDGTDVTTIAEGTIRVLPDVTRAVS